MPMELRNEVRVDRSGIVGDRYALGTGYWSNFPDQSGSAMTLISREVLDEVDIDSVQARRNVVTEGVSFEDLLGKTFRIGTILCIGVRPCDPCKYLEQAVRVGLRRDLRGIRGGLRVDVVGEGSFSVGDEIVLAP